MGRVKPSLVHKMLRAVDSQAFSVPPGWAIMSRYPPSELRESHPPPHELSPEELGVQQRSLPATSTKAPWSIYRELYARYPEVKLQPVRLNSMQPPLSKRFALRCVELMQQQHALDQDAAFMAAEAEFSDELGALGREQGTGTYLDFIQEEEQDALQSALKSLSEQRRQQAKLAGRASATASSSSSSSSSTPS